MPKPEPAMLIVARPPPISLAAVSNTAALNQALCAQGDLLRGYTANLARQDTTYPSAKGLFALFVYEYELRAREGNSLAGFPANATSRGTH